MKRILAAVALAFFASAAHAQTAPAPAAPAIDFNAVEIKATDLGKNTYLLTGAGGNMTLIVGKDAALLIDTQFAPLHDKIKTKINALTPVKVKYVTNTHYHGDHSGGNGAWSATGATIVGQKNLQLRLKDGVTNALTGVTTAPAAPGAVPSDVFDKSKTIKLGKRSVKLQYYPLAHTDGDTYVYLSDANVLVTGDIVSVGNRYPNIDVSVGGDIDGMIGAVDAFIRIANDKTKVVPGHGPLMNKADLKAYRENLNDARDAVWAMIEAGKSEAEIIAAKPLAAVQVKMGATDQASANFTRLIYRSLQPPTP
jgi:glyoxylase-like metal-dependent hydrolase (beta-lactamase superfamily II)